MQAVVHSRAAPQEDGSRSVFRWKPIEMHSCGVSPKTTSDNTLLRAHSGSVQREALPGTFEVQTHDTGLSGNQLPQWTAFSDSVCSDIANRVIAIPNRFGGRRSVCNPNRTQRTFGANATQVQPSNLRVALSALRGKRNPLSRIPDPQVRGRQDPGISERLGACTLLHPRCTSACPNWSEGRTQPKTSRSSSALQHSGFRERARVKTRLLRNTEMSHHD